MLGAACHRDKAPIFLYSREWGGAASGDTGMAETRAEPRQFGWGRVADYLFGRNTLIGIASFMLLIISGYATWHGMRDFIIGVSSTPTSQGQSLPGGMSISNDVLVIVVVVALTFLMWLMLRETFGAKRRLRERLITFPLYVFLAIWSIGFGYGFWWSLISGEEATRTGLAGLQEDARDASAVVAARLDAVRGQLDSVVSWSDSQMAREETSGGSCGTPSGAGRGPLYNARRSVRDSISTLRDGMTRSWLEPVQADVEQLKQSAAALGGSTVEERQRAFEARASDIRGRARNIAARSNQLGRSTAAEMRALASAVADRPGRRRVLLLRSDARRAAAAGRGAGRAAGGAQAARGGLQRRPGRRRQRGQEPVAQHRRLFLEPRGLRVLRRQAGGRPHRQRRADHRPRPDRAARHHRHRSRAAGAGHRQSAAGGAIDAPVRARLRRQINEAIDTAIARAGRGSRMGAAPLHPPQSRRSYLVIPNLYSGDRTNEEEVRQGAGDEPAGRRAERSGAGALAASARRLQEASCDKEEAVASDTDLTEIRKKWSRSRASDPAKAARQHNDRPMRNHGLFSKAERALRDCRLERARAQRHRDLPPGRYRGPDARC